MPKTRQVFVPQPVEDREPKDHEKDEVKLICGAKGIGRCPYRKGHEGPHSWEDITQLGYFRSLATQHRVENEEELKRRMNA